MVKQGAKPDDFLVALTWDCVENRAQFLVTRKYTGEGNTQKMLDEITKSSGCIHEYREEESDAGGSPVKGFD